MILRRVISHFRKQEWTAIALDFLIVVVGVFIGLQVSNWNEMRRERAVEHEYLERLYSDMQESLTPKPDRVEWDETRMAQQALVLRHLRSGVLPEADRQSFEQGLAHYGFVSGIDVDWATVDELQSTGAMNIIRDVSLRSLILRTDSDLRRRQGIIENFRQSIYAYRLQIGDRFGVVEFTGDRGNVSLDFDFEALAGDPGFINTLSQIDFLSRFIAQVADTEKADLRHLSDELAVRLGLDNDAAP